MEAKGPPTPIYCSALCLYETSSLDLIIKITHGDQEDHLSTQLWQYKRPKWRQIVIIPSTQRRINNQTRENYYFVTLFPKRECILKIYFRWAHLNNKENLHFQPADTESEKKTQVWHFGVDLLLQLDLQWWHCMHVHVSIPKPHPCTPDERDSVLQWWSRCNHTFCMFLHEI